MRTSLVALGLILISSFSEAKVKFEVQPLTIKAKGAQIIGMQSGRNAGYRKAIFFTGKTAQYLAQTAGKRIRPSREMLVMTGGDVDYLVEKGVAPAYKSKDYRNGAITAETPIFVTSKAFGQASQQIAVDAVQDYDYDWMAMNPILSIAKFAGYVGASALLAPLYVVASIGGYFVEGISGSFDNDRYGDVCTIPDKASQVGQLGCEGDLGAYPAPIDTYPTEDVPAYEKTPVQGSKIPSQAVAKTDQIVTPAIDQTQSKGVSKVPSVDTEQGYEQGHENIHDQGQTQDQGQDQSQDQSQDQDQSHDEDHAQEKMPSHKKK